MERQKKRLKNFIISLQVGWFLALRQVRRSSFATTALIIFVMTLTFLNLVVVRGVLVGLIEGSTEVYKTSYAGDVLITWDLPFGFEIISGDKITNCGSLDNGETCNFSIDVRSSVSTSSGINEIKIKGNYKNGI